MYVFPTPPVASTFITPSSKPVSQFNSIIASVVVPVPVVASKFGPDEARMFNFNWSYPSTVNSCKIEQFKTVSETVNE